MSINSMSATELKSLIDSAEEYTLIDCREHNEWDRGHIKEAKFMPLSTFEDELVNLQDKNARLILQCRSGKRSMTACKMLEENGYTNLTNLDGGILGWQESGFEITEAE